jgi:hypothetical protein
MKEIAGKRRRIGVHWRYIGQGKPQLNAFIMSRNDCLRDELLNEKLFDTLDGAHRKSVR